MDPASWHAASVAEGERQLRIQSAHSLDTAEPPMTTDPTAYRGAGSEDRLLTGRCIKALMLILNPDEPNLGART